MAAGDLTTLSTVKSWLKLTGRSISGITQANPAVITCPNHGANTGDLVSVSGVVGMTQINGVSYTVTVIDANTFSIGVSSLAWTAYASGGFVGVDDPLLTTLITASSAWIKNFINRDIVQTSYTETYDGTGASRLMLANYPVTAVASLTVDGLAVAASTGYGITGYIFDSNSIAYIGGSFDEDYGNVQVSYTAGYVTVPYDLAQACMELVAEAYRYRDRIGQSSEGFGPGHIGYTASVVNASIKTVLTQWKKVVPV